jgi:hypothetical protein
VGKLTSNSLRFTSRILYIAHGKVSRDARRRTGSYHRPSHSAFTANRCLLRLHGPRNPLRGWHRKAHMFLLVLCVPKAHLTMNPIVGPPSTQARPVIYHYTIRKGLNKILRLQGRKYGNVKRQVFILFSSYKTIES